MIQGWPLDYWQSKEWLDVQDKLDGLERDVIPYNPSRCDIFRALSLCSLDACRVCIIGQDPYPNPNFATGVAFSSRKTQDNVVHGGSGTVQDDIPASLRTIFREFCRDLSIPWWPETGCLEPWCERGVLLWNATPTVEIERTTDRLQRVGWRAYSHKYWSEWPPLTQEIVERLSAKGGIVFAFLGARAKEYAKYVDTGSGYNTCLFYSHPSPLAQQFTNNPFVGSRFFTTINDKLLNIHCKETIDWRL
jgi:uracil-DNA glycosylase